MKITSYNHHVRRLLSFREALVLKPRLPDSIEPSLLSNQPFRVLCERVGTFSRSRRESAFPSFPQALPPVPPSRSCLLPERAPRSRRPSDSTFQAMSHFQHFSSAGAEYFSPARERWLEISHDRVLQGRHNHVLCFRFRVFFAKAGRQSSPRPSLPKHRDLCHLARFALKGHGISRAAKALLVCSPSERPLARRKTLTGRVTFHNSNVAVYFGLYKALTLILINFLHALRDCLVAS